MVVISWRSWSNLRRDHGTGWICMPEFDHQDSKRLSFLIFVYQKIEIKEKKKNRMSCRNSSTVHLCYFFHPQKKSHVAVSGMPTRSTSVNSLSLFCNATCSVLTWPETFGFRFHPAPKSSMGPTAQAGCAFTDLTLGLYEVCGWDLRTVRLPQPKTKQIRNQNQSLNF